MICISVQAGDSHRMKLLRSTVINNYSCKTNCIANEIWPLQNRTHEIAIQKT